MVDVCCWGRGHILPLKLTDHQCWSTAGCCQTFNSDSSISDTTATATFPHVLLPSTVWIELEAFGALARSVPVHSALLCAGQVWLLCLPGSAPDCAFDRNRDNAHAGLAMLMLEADVSIAYRSI